MKAVITFILFLASALYGSLFRDVSPEARITDGYVASPKDFPYVATLVIRFINTAYICGGSIISNEYILIAAHCKPNPIQLLQSGDEPTYTVYVGSFVLEERIGLRINKDNIITHPRYNSETTENDIAHIRIPFTAYRNSIKPIRLPFITGKYSTCDNVGNKVLTVGWKDIRPSIIVLYNEQFIIQNVGCTPHHQMVTNKHICVSTSKSNAPTPGDSGGPLVKPSSSERDSELLLGVCSRGFNDISPTGRPVLYTRVSSYLKWIQHISGVAYYQQERHN